MKFSTWGKVWFGLLFADAAKTVVEELQAGRERASKFHGYPWQQAEQILKSIFDSNPTYCEQFKAMSDPDQKRHLDILFSTSPENFRRVVGFDRPPPWR